MPEIKKESESFLHDTGYIREHIKGSAGIAAPLFGLTGPTVKFIWNKERVAAIQALEQAMANPSILG